MSRAVNRYKKLIEERRASSLRQVLQDSLEYHFSNFKELERLADPYSVKDGDKTVGVAVRMKANTSIKFEVQAYINQLRRLKHFIGYLKREHGFEEPVDSEMRRIWGDIMEKDGMVNVLANKWAAHRSVDDPRGESESLHLAVLLNLEGTITMWGEGHLFLSIGEHSFYLFHYHPMALKFVDWIFETLEKTQCVGK